MEQLLPGEGGLQGSAPPRWEATMVKWEPAPGGFHWSHDCRVTYPAGRLAPSAPLLKARPGPQPGSPEDCRGGPEPLTLGPGPGAGRSPEGDPLGRVNQVQPRRKAPVSSLRAAPARLCRISSDWCARSRAARSPWAASWSSRSRSLTRRYRDPSNMVFLLRVTGDTVVDCHSVTWIRYRSK